MGSMELERAVFLVGAWVTHAAVGYALVRAFVDAAPLVGAGFGVLPDVDFLLPAAWEYPFVHRGLTHTPTFALVVVAVVYGGWRDRSLAAGAGLATGSHLLIDSLSPTGIPWTFPVGGQVGLGLPVHGPAATVLLWTGVAALLAWDLRRRGDGDWPSPA